MDDKLGLTYQKRKRQRQIRCIAGIVALIVAFFIGFLIGFLAMKAKSEHKDKKSGFKEQLEDMKKHHMKFQESVSEASLRNTLK